jgi:hypothetical protein
MSMPSYPGNEVFCQLSERKIRKAECLGKAEPGCDRPLPHRKGAVAAPDRHERNDQTIERSKHLHFFPFQRQFAQKDGLCFSRKARSQKDNSELLEVRF